MVVNKGKRSALREDLTLHMRSMECWNKVALPSIKFAIDLISQNNICPKYNEHILSQINLYIFFSVKLTFIVIDNCRKGY